MQKEQKEKMEPMHTNGITGKEHVMQEFKHLEKMCKHEIANDMNILYLVALLMVQQNTRMLKV